MIISDLAYVENISESTSVQGGTGSFPFPFPTYYQFDSVVMSFSSLNNFATTVNSPTTDSNSASAGAKGDAINNSHWPSYSFTKADTIAVTELYGGSFSGSSSAAVINSAWPY